MLVGYFSLAVSLWILFAVSNRMNDYFSNHPNSNKNRVSKFSVAGWVFVGFGVFEAVNSEFFATMGLLEGLMFIVMMNFGAIPIIGFSMYLSVFFKRIKLNEE